MKCSSCGSDVYKNWKFCPRCGSRLARMEQDLFSGVFSKVEKEFKEMNKLFEKDFETVDLSPWFRKPRSTGFSIKIVQGGGSPQVFVKTYGDADKNRLEKEVCNKFGVNQSPSIRERIFKPSPQKTPVCAIPKFTEEPKTKIKAMGNRVAVEIELPGVKSMNDIEVKDLENSVEVKALAGEKAYFKILTKPPQYRATKNEFRNGVLHLEFS